MERKKKMLEIGHGGLPRMPKDIPNDAQDLLDLMEHAVAIAGSAQGATAPAFDHGMRVFSLLHAHQQLRIAILLGKAHRELECATKGLRVATWGLAFATVFIAVLELWKLFHSH